MARINHLSLSGGIFLLLLLTQGCKKEKPELTHEPPKEKICKTGFYDESGQLLKEYIFINDRLIKAFIVNEHGQDSFLVEYDAAGKALKIYSSGYYGGAWKPYVENWIFFYNPNGTVSKINYALFGDRIREFYYDSSSLLPYRSHSYSSGGADYEDYVYDSKGSLIHKTIYEFNDDNGRMEKWADVDYEYDDKKNPDGDFLALTTPPASHNNVTLFTQSSYNIMSVTSTYEYNADGWPVKRMQTISSNQGVTTSTETIKYSCN